MSRHSWTDPTYQVECPMPDCTQPLYLDYATTASILPELLEEPAALTAGDHEAQDWKVTCLAGHVVLVPLEDASCGCGIAPDQGIGDPGADHDVHYAESEEDRRFTIKDVHRLADVIARLAR